MAAQIALNNNLVGAYMLPSSVTGQTVTTNSTYDLVLTINAAGIGVVTITATVGGTGPLTGLKLTTAAMAGGTHAAAYVDGDFNSPNRELIRCTNNAYTTASGNVFQMRIDLTGIAEVKIYGKSANGATIAFEVGA